MKKRKLIRNNPEPPPAKSLDWPDVRGALEELAVSLQYRHDIKRKLTRADVEAFCIDVQEYFSEHWRDDDNPVSEYMTRSSALAA